MISPRAMLPALGVAAAVAAVAALCWRSYQVGADDVRAEWEADKAALRAEHDAEVERLHAVNRQVDVRYIDRLRTVRGETETIIREVPVYVTAEDDSRCAVPDGFVSLHDRAAAGPHGVPASGAAAQPDGAAEAVALSHVAATVAGNYGTCHETMERLMALQAWARYLARGSSSLASDSPVSPSK